MRALWAIYKREMGASFNSPAIYIFIAGFVAVSVVLAINLGQLVEAQKADLVSFFQFLPWVYMIFVPALVMRTWAEENKSGTLEILLSLPVPSYILVLGKFLANASIIGLSLTCTFGLWLNLNFWGEIDNGAALGSYIGALISALGFVAISSAMSAISKNQIIAFVMAAFICFIFMGIGLPIFDENLGAGISEYLSKLSIYKNYQDLMAGQISLNAIIYFIILSGFWLIITTLVIDGKRSAQ